MVTALLDPQTAWSTHCISIVFIASAKIPEREENISPSSFLGQLPDYQSHVFSLTYQVYKFPLKKIKTWSQSKISPYCFVFGVNQEYLEVEGSQTFSCVTPVVETFSLHRVAFRAQSNINEGATLQKQPTALTR